MNTTTPNYGFALDDHRFADRDQWIKSVFCKVDTVVKRLEDRVVELEAQVSALEGNTPPDEPEETTPFSLAIVTAGTAEEQPFVGYSNGQDTYAQTIFGAIDNVSGQPMIAAFTVTDQPVDNINIMFVGDHVAAIEGLWLTITNISTDTVEHESQLLDAAYTTEGPAGTTTVVPYADAFFDFVDGVDYEVKIIERAVIQ